MGNTYEYNGKMFDSRDDALEYAVREKCDIDPNVEIVFVEEDFDE